MAGRTRLLLILAVAVFVGALPSCGSGLPSVGTLDRDGPEEDTTLGAGDVFEVRVFGETDLSSRYRISQDGTIDFPLVGRVAVAGLEPTEVADALSARLRDGQYLVRPDVSVFVEEYNSKRVSVLGAVSSAGTFPVSAGLTVVQAISLAGGFTALANRDGTVLSRRGESGDVTRVRVPIDQITQGNLEDVTVRGGDILYVPERVF